MIVVIASIYDTNAVQFVTNYSAVENIKLLTAVDLASAGWRSYLEDSNRKDSFCIKKKEYKINEIDSVLTLLPVVTEQELPFIEADDKVYIAREMNAFLLAWLYKLGDKVINKPTASSLIGTHYRPVTWLLNISKYNFEVEKNYFDTFNIDINCSTTNLKIYIIGNKIFGAKDKNIENKLKKFIKEYDIALLTIEYTLKNKMIINNIYPMVDINIPYIQKALINMCKRIEYDTSMGT